MANEDARSPGMSKTLHFLCPRRRRPAQPPRATSTRSPPWARRRVLSQCCALHGSLPANPAACLALATRALACQHKVPERQACDRVMSRHSEEQEFFLSCEPRANLSMHRVTPRPSTARTVVFTVPRLCGRARIASAACQRFWLPAVDGDRLSAGARRRHRLARPSHPRFAFHEHCQR